MTAHALAEPAIGPERFELRRRTVIRWLVALYAAVLVLHFLVMYARFGLGHRWLGGFSNILNVDEEESLSQFIQMLNLLGASALLLVIGRRAKRLGLPHAFGWLAMAAIFLYLAIDESTRIHEQAIVPLQNALDAGGIFFFTWIVVAIPLVIVFAVLYVPLLRDLDRRTRTAFILAGLLYLGGTIGMEMAGGVWVEERTFNDVIYLSGFVVVEEVLEFAGQVVFLWALLGLVARDQPVIQIRVENR